MDQLKEERLLIAKQELQSAGVKFMNFFQKWKQDAMLSQAKKVL